jgi:hypothetical protein
MILFEITTDRIGESYERAYAWASCEGEARALFWAKHTFPPWRTINITVQPLFSSEEKPFCTDLSDSGFEMRVTE